MTSKRSMAKQLTNARVTLTLNERPHTAECSIFVESYGPPPRWHGRLWALSPAATLKRGDRLTLTLPKGATAEVTVHKLGFRGAFEFRGEGLAPDF